MACNCTELLDDLYDKFELIYEYLEEIWDIVKTDLKFKEKLKPIEEDLWEIIRMATVGGLLNG